MTPSMSTIGPGQKLLIQLETALHRLVESFWEEPYRYFTKSDVVAALPRWVINRPELARAYHTADGFEAGLLHSDHPSPSRFDVDHPGDCLATPASRRHYDLVLFHPDYIEQHPAETICSPSPEDRADRPSPPLLAVIEFGLLTGHESLAADPNARCSLDELSFALEPPADTSTAYLCIFCRELTSRPDAHDAYQQMVEDWLSEFPEVRTVIAVCWPKQDWEPFVYYAGPWLTIEAE